MSESDPAHNIIATTVPPLSPNTMLESATQSSSTMSIYSIVNHNTPPDFITQPMGTLNDLSQLAVPSGPHSFAPDLVYGATSDASPFYSSDSCYSPNSEYSRARIAGQSHRQSRSFSAIMMDPLEPRMCMHTTSTHPGWRETGRNPNGGLRTNPSLKSRKLNPGAPSSTSATSGKAITSPSPERKRKNTPIGTDKNAVLSRHLVAHGPRSQPSPPIWSQQISSAAKRPRKSIRASSPTAAHSAAVGRTDVLSSCFDAPSHRTLETTVLNKEVEVNRGVETNETVEEGRQLDPDQVVKNLLRKWTTLHDMPLGPSYGK